MASTGDTWRLGHRPALDGLRGVAITLVLLGHSWLPGFHGGGVTGVTVFFVLSGFLITSLLLEERTATGRMSLSDFYRRRARRLLPALLASIAAVALASTVIGSWFFRWRDALAVIGYVGNWVEVYGNLGNLGGLAGTWSLAVEEQFYLLWPLAVILCLRRGRGWLVAVTVAGIIASVVARTVLWQAGAGVQRVYYGSDMHADALLAGCLLAIALHGSRGRGSSLPWAVLGGLALLPLVSAEGGDMYVVTPVLATAATAVMIWSAVTRETRWLSWSPLVWMGRRSYGLYLWHCPISAFMTLAHPEWAWPVRATLILGLGLPLAELSWRFIERPFLEAKAGGRDLVVAGSPGRVVGHVGAVPEVHLGPA